MTLAALAAPALQATLQPSHFNHSSSSPHGAARTAGNRRERAHSSFLHTLGAQVTHHAILLSRQVLGTLHSPTAQAGQRTLPAPGPSPRTDRRPVHRIQHNRTVSLRMDKPRHCECNCARGCRVTRYPGTRHNPLMARMQACGKPLPLAHFDTRHRRQRAPLRVRLCTGVPSNPVTRNKAQSPNVPGSLAHFHTHHKRISQAKVLGTRPHPTDLAHRGQRHTMTATPPGYDSSKVSRTIGPHRSARSHSITARAVSHTAMITGNQHLPIVRPA